MTRRQWAFVVVLVAVFSVTSFCLGNRVFAHHPTAPVQPQVSSIEPEPLSAEFGGPLVYSLLGDVYYHTADCPTIKNGPSIGREPISMLLTTARKYGLKPCPLCDPK